MKTFIINLERSTKRREHILNEVRKHDLDFELIKGVDGRQLSEEEVGRLMNMEEARKNPATLTRGTLGCALSHLKIYEKMLAENIDMAFVLEDDAVLPDNIDAILKDVERNIRRNEVILLYFFSFKPCKLSEQNAAPLSNGYQLMYPVEVRQPVTATAYVITQDAARTLSKTILPVKIQADEWGYFYENGGIEQFRCIYPIPVKISGAKSDIQQFRQSALRVKFTKFVDDYRIPPFYQLLRRARLSNVESWSAVELVDEPSPMFKSVTR